MSTSVDILFNDDFNGSQAPQLTRIKALLQTNEVNIYSTKYYSQEVNTPSAAVTFMKITTSPNAISPLSEGGEDEITFFPQTGIGHLDSIFMSLKITSSNPADTACELYPYMWFGKLDIRYVDEIFVRQIDPSFMLAYMFMKMRQNTRNRLLRLANSTAALDGTTLQTICLPTMWCPIMNSTYTPPLPIRRVTGQLSFTLTSRKYSEWLTAYTPGVSQLTINMALVARSVVFYGSSSATPGQGHPTDWTIAFENPILGVKLGLPIPAATDTQVNIVEGLDSRKLKGLFLYFRKTADYDPTVAPTLTNRFFFHGGMPSKFEYAPQSQTAFDKINTPGLVMMMMLSSWLGLDFYDTVGSTVTNTWENSLFFSYGPRYSVQDIDGSYYYETGDSSNFIVNYPAAGRLFLVGIAYQIIALDYSLSSIPEKAVMVFKYGAKVTA